MRLIKIETIEPYPHGSQSKPITRIHCTDICPTCDTVRLLTAYDKTLEEMTELYGGKPCTPCGQASYCVGDAALSEGE
jgi:hypothetical protein